MRFLRSAPASGVLDALECRRGLRAEDLELARVVLVRHSIVISSAAPAVCSSGRGCEILQASSGITIMILIYAEQLALALARSFLMQSNQQPSLSVISDRAQQKVAEMMPCVAEIRARAPTPARHKL
jgi:hypothetical protein